MLGNGGEREGDGDLSRGSVDPEENAHRHFVRSDCECTWLFEYTSHDSVCAVPALCMRKCLAAFVRVCVCVCVCVCATNRG